MGTCVVLLHAAREAPRRASSDKNHHVLYMWSILQHIEL
jgi:hypothetical protein